MTRVAALTLALASTLGSCGTKDAGSRPPGPTAAAPALPAPAPPAPALPAPVVATRALELPMAPRAVGTRWVTTDDVQSTLLIHVAADELRTIDSTQHKVDDLEVVELDAAGLVAKVRAHYPERTATDRQGTETQARVSPLAGKTYLAWSKGGALEATHADGSAVTADELEDLHESLDDDLGKPQVVHQTLASRAWTIGETYAFTADDLARLAAASGKRSKAAAMTLTLHDVTGGAATFGITSSVAIAGKAELTAELSGSVTIDVATGRPVALSLAGPVKGTVLGKAVTGTMSGTTSYAYPAR
jgi:hypothetical protein